MATPEEQKNNQGKGFFRYWMERGFTEAWNNSWFGRKTGKFPKETRQGNEELAPVLGEFRSEFALNQSMITECGLIEDKWGSLEFDVFPYAGGKDLSNIRYGENPLEKSIDDREPITNLYRAIQYFRDIDIVTEETHIFETRGTIEIKDRKFSIGDDEEIRDRMEKNAQDLRTKREREGLNEQEIKDLADMEEFLSDYENKLLTITILKDLDPHEIQLPFLNGERENIIAFGIGNIPMIRGATQALRENINQFASGNGVPAPVRQSVDQVMNRLNDALTEIQKIESDHFVKLHHEVLGAMRSIQSLATKAEQFRPDKNLIRFPHTYKIIKPFRTVKTKKNGEESFDVKYFKDEYPEFRRNDEIEAGLDENGWPLEVDPETREVLLDSWWVELSQNKWHGMVIQKKDKDRGSNMWKNKVEDGVKKSPAYKDVKNTGHGYIRRIPKEYIGDLDPLDKIMFIYNEWDSFRDDFRDGRYHPHSKTSMDYIIAGKKDITPLKNISKIDTTKPSERIKFIPLYYSEYDESEGIRKKADNEKNNQWHERRRRLVKGSDKIRGEIREGHPLKIPADEKEVSRVYNVDHNMKSENENVEFEVSTQYNMSRKPTPFDPAFDRAALQSAFLHWGRMYYYETPDGINRWSENPFPVVTTRGIGKYLIDLTLRRTFGFEAARNALRSKKWDFGVRHWGEPFITDPLGEAVPGPAGQGGRGQLAGAK